jgi:hypothetical protein
MSFFTVGWQPPANIGWLPRHSGDGTDPFFAVGWTPKQSATYYPYAGKGLVVTPGEPDPTPTPVTPAATATPAATQPASIRAHIAEASLLTRKNPTLFRRHGLKFAIALEAPAKVTAVLVVAKTGRKLTHTQSRTVKAGTSHMTLLPGLFGRAIALREKSTQARLEITIHYTDGSKGTLHRSVLIATN